MYYGDGTTEDKVSIRSHGGKRVIGAWLTVPPLSHLCLRLNEREFRDTVQLRYDWTLDDISSMCVWGKFYRRPLSDLQNRRFCYKAPQRAKRSGSGTSDGTVFSDFKTEPALKDISGEQLRRGSNKAQDARLDIYARGVPGAPTISIL